MRVVCESRVSVQLREQGMRSVPVMEMDDSFTREASVSVGMKKMEVQLESMPASVHVESDVIQREEDEEEEEEEVPMSEVMSRVEELEHTMLRRNEGKFVSAGLLSSNAPSVIVMDEPSERERAPSEELAMHVSKKVQVVLVTEMSEDDQVQRESEESI